MSARDDLELEEQFFPTSSALLERRFPWLRLFRAFRMACDYRRLILAMAAVLLWAWGDWIIAFSLPLPPSQFDGTSTDPDIIWPWQTTSLTYDFGVRSHPDLTIALNRPHSVLGESLLGGRAILSPWERMRQAAAPLLDSSLPFGRWIAAMLSLAWALVVTAIFGGAISRMAAVEFAEQDGGSLRRAARYSIRHVVSYIGAPLTTVVGIVLCWIPGMVAGWFVHVPLIGGTLVSVMYVIPVFFGFLMALILAGVVAGWPLMYAAVSVDRSDAFDALSRAYSYVFNRPWYALFLTVLATLYGSIVLYFLTGMLLLSLQLTGLAMGSGSGVQFITDSTPAQLEQARFLAMMEVHGDVPRSALGFWTAILGSIPSAFIFSYFWTAATIIYVLLRRREDGVLLDEVASETNGATQNEDLPLTGARAADRKQQS